MKLSDWASRRFFGFVHGNNLVYNACWEDPRLDRVALGLTPDDVVLVITSAGCNALEYALDEPRHVYAVDMNVRQNALLDLKIAGIRQLDFEAFFELFGTGRMPHARDLYLRRLRTALPTESRAYWDRHIEFFSGRGLRSSFYFHGTTGYFAWLINAYIHRVARLGSHVDALLSAASLPEQQEIYGQVRQSLWSGFIYWLIGRDATMALLGVPPAQRRQIDRDAAGGLQRFVERCVETVFAHLPLGDNYFWRVYLTGRYTPECCPEYLRPQQFARLKRGLVDRVSTHTLRIADFVRQAEAPISRFVLLDHMDWFSHRDMPLLQRQWETIFDRAAPNARLLWRSAGTHCKHLDALPIRRRGTTLRLGELLRYHPEMAAELHARDRVHTYGSFYIADLVA